MWLEDRRWHLKGFLVLGNAQMWILGDKGMWNSAFFAALSSPLNSHGYTTDSGAFNCDWFKPDITAR